VRSVTAALVKLEAGEWPVAPACTLPSAATHSPTGTSALQRSTLASDGECFRAAVHADTCGKVFSGILTEHLHMLLEVLDLGSDFIPLMLA